MKLFFHNPDSQAALALLKEKYGTILTVKLIKAEQKRHTPQLTIAEACLILIEKE